MHENDNESIYREKVKLLFTLLPAGSVATLVNSTIITFLHWHLVPHWFLFSWIIAMYSLSFFRILQYSLFKLSKDDNLDYHKWNYIFQIGIILSGTLWGVAAFFSRFNASELHHLLIAYVLGGMAAGATGAFSITRTSFYGFALPAVLPQIIIFFGEGKQINFAMGAMMLLFLVLISISAESNRNVTNTSLSLRFEKNRLIKSLSNEKETTEKVNRKLHEEIELRKHSEAQLQVARDELERKVKERTADLQFANESLEEKNRELDSFTNSVSHDLKSPLQSVIGFTKMISEDYSDKLNGIGKGYLKRITESAAKMDSIINDLLKLSRISRQQLAKEKVNLCQIAGQVIKDLIKGEPSRKVEVKIQTDLSHMADPGLIVIALTNLIGNAWKYTKNVECACIEFGHFIKDNQEIFFIKDNGAGFDMARADKLFKPFQRLHSEKEFSGTGIGLVIVQRVIQKHGGRIWAESAPGKGTTFYFTLG
jgi:signal transduction histidine kinase